MRSEILIQLQKNYDYFLYIRENPSWHKILTRDPTRIKDFFDEYKVKRRKRLVDKIDDLSMMITLAKELI